MGIEKSAVKLAALHTVGLELDDSLEAARKELGQIEGRIVATQLIGELIQALTKAVDRDIDEGKVPTGEPLQVAAYVKDYIFKARQLALDEGTRSVHARFEHQGRITAWQEAVKKVKKLHDTQRTKLELLEQSLTARLESGSSEEVNPRPSWKEQQARRDEEEMKKALLEGEDVALLKSAEEPPKPKKRGKPRKRKKASNAVQN